MHQAGRIGNIVDVLGLIKRATDDAVRQMEQIAFLFNHALYMLRLKMPVLAGNDLIIRYLIEQEDKACQLWGENLEDIFSDMFSGGAVEGFCVAGRSYQAGQWFNLALEMYRRALEVDPGCDEAIAKTVQLERVVKDSREFSVA